MNDSSPEVHQVSDVIATLFATELNNHNLSADHRDELLSLLCKFHTIVSRDDIDLGRTGIIKHRINTGNHQTTKPLRRPPVTPG